MWNVLKSKSEKNITFPFSPCKEEVKGRMGRTAEKRERRGGAEAAGEERKRGDSCHRRINALRILLVSWCGKWWGWRLRYRHSRAWAPVFCLERVVCLVKYTLEFASGALECFVCALADTLIKVFLQLYPSLPFVPGIGKLCEGPECKHFRLYGSYGVCCKHPALASVPWKQP